MKSDLITAAPRDLSAFSRSVWAAVVPSRASVGRKLAIGIALRLLDTAERARADLKKQKLTSVTKRTRVTRLNPLARLAHQADLDFLNAWIRLGLHFDALRDGAAMPPDVDEEAGEIE